MYSSKWVVFISVLFPPFLSRCLHAFERKFTLLQQVRLTGAYNLIGGFKGGYFTLPRRENFNSLDPIVMFVLLLHRIAFIITLNGCVQVVSRASRRSPEYHDGDKEHSGDDVPIGLL